jgi:hypothetical protein
LLFACSVLVVCDLFVSQPAPKGAQRNLKIKGFCLSACNKLFVSLQQNCHGTLRGRLSLAMSDDRTALPHTPRATDPKTTYPPTHIKRDLAQTTRWSIMRPWRAASGGGCMSSVKKEEAKRAILSEYDGWAKKHLHDAIMMGGFLFYRYLQNERSNLLDFRAVGSKGQIVHDWIQNRVGD